TTSTLARLRSTTELHPRVCFLLFRRLAWERGYYTRLSRRCKTFFAKIGNFSKNMAFFTIFG
ncbi:MAG: hypothetical protein Q4F38_00735, partial [Akkermansia sp.]|nr:hypothetical protein [Akkermansia sp.]